MKIQPSPGEKNKEAATNLVTFRVGKEIYGLPAQVIIQILPMVTITPLPEIGDPVAGVINVRGQVVPVVDMRRHVGRGEAAYQLYTPIILSRVGQDVVGLVVDEVLDVLSLRASDLVPPAAILPEELGQVPILQALTYISGDLALLLDPEHLFKPEQREALAQAVEMLSHLADNDAATGPESILESSR